MENCKVSTTLLSFTQQFKNQAETYAGKELHFEATRLLQEAICEVVVALFCVRNEENIQS